jgi:NAD(P)-dependent dehydrogenase (short-subunit alcohol dehydrogenase family)
VNASKRRIWLVTGANSGFGQAVVEAAVAAGEAPASQPGSRSPATPPSIDDHGALKRQVAVNAVLGSSDRRGAGSSRCAACGQRCIPRTCVELERLS